MSLLTIEGLYNYDSSLFDSFEVPTGLDKQTAIDTILMRTRELEVLYPDLDFMKRRISIWSRKYQANWKKLYDTTVLEYNPIENYDRKESWTDTDNETGSNSRSNIVNRSDNDVTDSSNSGKSTNSNKTMSSGNVTDQNTAFNGGLMDHAKQITDGDVTENGTITNTETGKVTVDRTGKVTESESASDKRNTERVREGRAHGNIGVTTTQQMIQSERETVVFNLYDVIAESFVENFCLMVY